MRVSAVTVIKPPITTMANGRWISEPGPVANNSGTRPKAVIEAAGGSFKDVVKLNIFLTDLSHFAKVNEIMGRYFTQPYPARAAIGVAALPKGAQVEMDAIVVLE